MRNQAGAPFVSLPPGTANTRRTTSHSSPRPVPGEDSSRTARRCFSPAREVAGGARGAGAKDVPRMSNEDLTLPVFFEFIMRVKRQASSVKRQASSVKRQASSVKRQASSVKRQASSVKRQASSVKRQASSVKRQASSVKRQASSVKRQASSVKRQASSVKRQASSVKRQASSVKRQASSVKRQASSVKHPIGDRRRTVGPVCRTLFALNAHQTSLRAGDLPAGPFPAFSHSPSGRVARRRRANGFRMLAPFHSVRHAAALSGFPNKEAK